MVLMQNPDDIRRKARVLTHCKRNHIATPSTRDISEMMK